MKVARFVLAAVIAVSIPLMGVSATQAADVQPSNADLKAAVSSKVTAPTKRIGTNAKPGVVTLLKKQPGADICWGMDGNPKSLPDGATSAVMGWEYKANGENMLVDTTVWRYGSAAKAKKAATMLATMDCPAEASRITDIDVAPVPTEQTWDLVKGKNGPTYISTYTYTEGGKSWVSVTTTRVDGNTVVQSNGDAPSPLKVKPMVDWTFKTVNAVTELLR
jgi:hypothetical protein